VSALSEIKRDPLVWSQKRKARSASEMLGLGILVAASVKETLRGYPSTAQLFDELQTLRFVIEGASPNGKAHIMQRVEDCERYAPKHPVFNDFVGLRWRC
jgi:hypothetical protein